MLASIISLFVIVFYLQAHLCSYFNFLPHFATRCLLIFFPSRFFFCAHKLCCRYELFCLKPTPAFLEAALEQDFAIYHSFSCQLDVDLQSPGKREAQAMSSLDGIGCVCISEAISWLLIDVGMSHPIVCGASLRQIGLGYTGKTAEQARGKNSTQHSSVFSGSILSSGSCLEFWLPSVMDCNL